ncbi:arginine--tRNA ligase [Pseudobacteroides cellulosolvens]|uniref:Arginine--tRNA ligase n=1 Tax=Pseudobacteroides cellulosolvens ATCC 35603 = DSM 2933 TaxID=398512 RepID=A0A0L6JR93_9FIRM|nr:arginine--tRNA ligase [Pseudobacteroides cellulosolvens]KNY28298.1 Arginyl-tRNA synthetase [Pseudobacteroides cellulosolvens ATCC 35603 = DSM 2933]
MKSLKKEIANTISKQVELDIAEIERLIEIPPNSDLGDYAFPCFQLSKAFRKAPNIIAAEMAEKLEKPLIIDKIISAGGYVNFFVNKGNFASAVLKGIAKEGAGYGRSDIGNGKTVLIDYCATNIAKPFHIGHLPTTVIGDSLNRIYKFLGYECVGINHIGDWGTQFGKLIVAYKKWGNKEEIEKNPIKELVKIYVRFHDEAEDDESLNDEGRAAFKAIENGDSEYVQLWKWFREVSIAEFKRVLKVLNVEFDSWDGESFFTDKMEPVIEELRNKKLLQESQGAQIVDLTQFDMPPCLILRSDGATLYATRDLAAILYRKEKYDFHKVLYCVATQQNLHFRQIFKVVDLMGYEWANNLVHVANGMISLETGAMGTRKGTVVYLDDVLNESVSKAMEKIEEKNPKLEGKEVVAKIVGIGAVKFSALKNKRMKDSVFVWDKVLNFEGETSCYIQYTHARICSVLEKTDFSKELDIEYELLTDDKSYEVIKTLALFPQVIIDAAEEYEPSDISKYLIDLVQSFNKFYHENHVLSSEGKLRDSRIELCKAVKIVISTGMGLLGIECPEKM